MKDNYIYNFDKSKKIDKFLLKYLIQNGEFKVAWFLVAEFLLEMQISEWHKKAADFWLQDEDMLLLMAPRGIGKSYFLNTAYTLTHILRDNCIRIMVFTASQDQSKDFIKQIKELLEPGSKVYSVFGDLRGNKARDWGAEQITIKRPQGIREPSITAGTKASGNKFTSFHYDLILGDDIVSINNCNTLHKQEEFVNFMNQVVKYARDPYNKYSKKRYGGKIKLIGTHYHALDYYSYLEENNICPILKLKALYKGKDGEYKSLDSNRYTVEELQEQEEKDGYSFLLQMQQQVLKNKDGIFKPEWEQVFPEIKKETGINGDLKNVYVKVYNDLEEKYEYKTIEEINIGVDLAISKKDNADFFVIAVVGKDKENLLYILDLYVNKISFTKQMEKIQEYYKKWNVDLCAIESVAYQQALANTLINNTYLNIKKVNTKEDKVTRMNKLSVKWENQQIYIYDKIPHKKELFTELYSFPESTHDDILDAIEFAISSFFNKNVIGTVKSKKVRQQRQRRISF